MLLTSAQFLLLPIIAVISKVSSTGVLKSSPEHDVLVDSQETEQEITLQIRLLMRSGRCPVRKFLKFDEIHLEVQDLWFRLPSDSNVQIHGFIRSDWLAFQ